MVNAIKGYKQLAAAGGDNAPIIAPLTEVAVRDLVESILKNRLPPPAGEHRLIDFTELTKRIPMSPRSLRDGIKKGWIPSLRFPGGRRLFFDWDLVRASLRRFEKGGLE